MSTTVRNSNLLCGKQKFFFRLHPSCRLYLNSQVFRRWHKLLLRCGDQLRCGLSSKMQIWWRSTVTDIRVCFQQALGKHYPFYGLRSYIPQLLFTFRRKDKKLTSLTSKIGALQNQLRPINCLCWKQKQSSALILEWYIWSFSTIEHMQEDSLILASVEFKHTILKCIKAGWLHQPCPNWSNRELKFPDPDKLSKGHCETGSKSTAEDRLWSLEMSCLNSHSSIFFTVSQGHQNKWNQILKTGRQWRRFPIVTPPIKPAHIWHSWCNSCLATIHRRSSKCSHVTALQRKIKSIGCMWAKPFMNFHVTYSLYTISS